jgi:hypothetical protein
MRPIGGWLLFFYIQIFGGLLFTLIGTCGVFFYLGADFVGAKGLDHALPLRKIPEHIADKHGLYVP